MDQSPPSEGRGKRPASSSSGKIDSFTQHWAKQHQESTEGQPPSSKRVRLDPTDQGSGHTTADTEQLSFLTRLDKNKVSEAYEYANTMTQTSNQGNQRQWNDYAFSLGYIDAYLCDPTKHKEDALEHSRNITQKISSSRYGPSIKEHWEELTGVASTAQDNASSTSKGKGHMAEALQEPSRDQEAISLPPTRPSGRQLIPNFEEWTRGVDEQIKRIQVSRATKTASSSRVDMASSSMTDHAAAEPEHTFGKRVSDLNDQQLDRLITIARTINGKVGRSPLIKEYYHRVVRHLDKALHSRYRTAFPRKKDWSEGTEPPNDPDRALFLAVDAMRNPLPGMQGDTHQELPDYADEIEKMMTPSH